MAKKAKGHSKKKRHQGVGLKYRPTSTKKEVKMARRGRVKVTDKYITVVSSTGKKRAVKDDTTHV